MLTLFQFVTPPYQCTYLPDQLARMQYEIVSSLTPDEYQNRLLAGWRRFGFSLFHPVCANCRACQSLRIPVDRFESNRSQRRAWRDNQDLTLVIGEPRVTRDKLDLYDRFHLQQSMRIGWNEPEPKDAESYNQSFVQNPFPTQEWCYYLGDKLVGVGYVDILPKATSAIYFYHDPDLSKRSLGTFNVLSIIDRTRRLGIPHLYLGYFVEGCRSLEYKGRFRPNQVIDARGAWLDFLL
jgi:arginine-tRNA-protein transferase